MAAVRRQRPGRRRDAAEGLHGPVVAAAQLAEQRRAVGRRRAEPGRTRPGGGDVHFTFTRHILVAFLAVYWYTKLLWDVQFTLTRHIPKLLLGSRRRRGRMTHADGRSPYTQPSRAQVQPTGPAAAAC